MRMRRALASGALAAALLLGACGDGDTGLGLNLVSQEQTEQMGLEAWQQIRAEGEPVRDAAMQRRAEGIAERLLRAAGEDPAAWEVVVFRGDEVNAFALPGGKIGVYEGMMELADSDDQLAAVIAHEIAHNEAAHAQERLSSQIATQTGIDLASAVLGGATSADRNLIAGILGAGAQYGVLLPYSRNQELEADELGLCYMAQAGYNPEAAVALWRKMQGETAGVPSFLSTHPAPAERIESLQAQLPEAMEAYRANR